jgi:hypothetical protein
MTKEERKMLDQVAAILKRSASDAIRYLIFHAASIARKDGQNEREND